MRSPNVPIEAQLLVFLGAGNIRGFSQIQSITTINAGSVHQPSESLNARAALKRGRIEKREYTLNGLECRCQAHSSIDINRSAAFKISTVPPKPSRPVSTLRGYYTKPKLNEQKTQQWNGNIPSAGLQS
ncbi:hypothetical protein J4N42_21735 [Vibrio sp. SCSIO 43135]|nr:hypothetical protein [Vibrio sp. SCSIO 43135]USD43215.1 hypothetical protein J4N42_21735 [Vibrio sp. SCSIO 43135]